MSQNPSPSLAAFLSFIFPGLGQIYAGDLRKGVMWAIPMLLIIVAGLFLVLGGSAALTAFLTAERVLALIVFNVAFFLYHIAAMIDAYDVAKHERSFGYTRRAAGSAPVVLALLVSLAIVIHGLPTMIGLIPAYNFLISQSGHPDVIPQASFAHQTLPPTTPAPSGLETTGPDATQTPGSTQTPGGTVSPTGTAAPTANGSGKPVSTVKPKVCPQAPDLSGWVTQDGKAPAADGRLDILLVGSDSRSDTGASDNSLRTDSMLLLSVDIAECKAALFSFPRNMTEINDPTISRYPTWLHIPTQNGTDYPGYLFGLWRDAAASPQSYPGSDGIGSECQTQFDCERGWTALSFAIQEMSGVPIDGIIAVNLKGFVDIVNNLPGGGVWLDIPEALQDDAYYNSQQQLYKVDFKPGCQFLDAEDTLAYARSRHQDSDYQRERRQQFVLQSIRKQLDPIAMLPNIGGLLNAAQQNLFMTFSSNDFPYLAQIASRVDADRLYQYDFAPAHLTPLGSMQGMQAKVQNIFSEPEPEPEPNQQNNNCPPKN